MLGEGKREGKWEMRWRLNKSNLFSSLFLFVCFSMQSFCVNIYSNLCDDFLTFTSLYRKHTNFISYLVMVFKSGNSIINCDNICISFITIINFEFPLLWTIFMLSFYILVLFWSLFFKWFLSHFWMTGGRKLFLDRGFCIYF